MLRSYLSLMIISGMHHIPPTIFIRYSITPKWSKQQKIWSTENKLQQTTTSMAILVTITNIFTKIIYWTNSFIFRGCPRTICECYGWTVNHNVSFIARGINFLTKTTKENPSVQWCPWGYIKNSSQLMEHIYTSFTF